jgi:3-deoxy-D-manno-octulosonic-acid transferase
MSAIAHKTLKKNFKNLVTIIIPRHINRVDKIIKEIEDLGLITHLHSSKNKIKKNTEIYIVDTYGETEKFFNICKTIFVGGSLVKHGGQNPLEPARLGCKIIHGPSVNNFNEIYSLLDNNKIAIKVNNLNQFISKIRIIMKKNVSSEKLISKLKKLGDEILYSTLLEIKKLIN